MRLEPIKPQRCPPNRHRVRHTGTPRLSGRQPNSGRLPELSFVLVAVFLFVRRLPWLLFLIPDISGTTFRLVVIPVSCPAAVKCCVPSAASFPKVLRI